MTRHSLTRGGLTAATMLIVAVACPALPGVAKVIGTMTAAEPLTDARIATLPPAQRKPWAEYLARSRAAMAADKAALAAERRAAPAPAPGGPPSGSTRSMPLDRPAAWYGGPEARAIADNIVSFQTPAGGWGKNQDRAGPPRRPGQSFVPGESLPPGAQESPAAGGDGNWRYVGTIDNGATVTELQFLARVQATVPGGDGDRYRAAIAKGIRYLLAAEFPGGGWPQVYPLQGGYHDALTFNDDALADVANVLLAAGDPRGDFAFLPADLRTAAGAAVARTTRLLLDTQVTIDGRRTIWAQQHDALTRAPAGARNFEPAALSTAESVTLLDFLMRQPDRSPAVEAAVAAGIAWLRAHALRDVAWQRAAPADGGNRLVATPGAPPLWARLYAIDTQQPVFGDRDRTIHDDVADLSPERRNGYSWYTNAPARLIARYEGRARTERH